MRILANKPKGGKSTSSRSGSTSKTSAAKKNARKADVKYESHTTKKGGKGKAKAPSYSAKHFMISVILGALALFIVASYAFPQTEGVGVIGEFIRNAMFGVFGGGAILLPALLFVEAIFLKRDVKNGKIASRPVSAAVTILMVSSLLHAAFAVGTPELNITFATFTIDAIGVFFTKGMSLIGGGVIGGLIGMLIMSLIGSIGTIIVAVLLILFCAIFVFGLSLSDLKMKYMRFQEKRAIKNQEKAEAEVRRAEEAAIASKREEMRRTEMEKAEAAERKRKEDEERELERIRQNTQAHNERASQIRRELERSKNAVYDYEDEDTETDEMPRARKHGDIEEIFQAGLIEDTEPEVFDDEQEDDGDKEFRGESVDEFWLENDPNTETTFVEVPDMGESAEFPTEGGDEGEFEGESFETIDAGYGMDGEEPAEGEEVFADTYEEGFSGVTENTEELELTGETPLPDDVTPWEEVIGTAGEEGAESEEKAEAAEAAEGDPVTDGLRRTLDETRQRMQENAPAAEPPAAQEAVPPAEPEEPAYVFPPLDLLEADPNEGVDGEYGELQESAETLIETLKNFKVNAKVVDIFRGPTITRFEIALATGTRVNTVKNLADDISYALATNGVRIEQIPGKSAIGIEVPNMGARDTVYLRSLLEDEKFTEAKSKLTTALGKGVSGEHVYLDIAKMPHLLIAGTTGSGKSVCINTMLISLLYKATPDEVKLVLVDPKKVELNIYNGIPHLLVPVVFDPKKAAGALHWCVTEMERRFDLIESMNVRNIDGYNKAIADDPNKEKLPQIVIVIDELADLMMTASNEVETSICRIAQKARAAGMHLIIGTQRPSVDVITGLIKANVPSRIAFTVMSQVDSRTIIDQVGAEKLIGRGDMLYAPVGSKPMRAQGAFVSDAELEGIIEFIKENAKKAEYSGEIMSRIEKEAALCGKKGKARDEAIDAMEDSEEEEEDPKLEAAIKLAVESGKISTSLIQRKLSLGYGRAAKIIDVMERRGIVAPPEGQKPREVLISKEQYLEMSMRKDGAAGGAMHKTSETPSARQMQRTGEMPSARQMQRTGEMPSARQMQRTGEMPSARQMQRTGEMPSARQMQRTGEMPSARQMQRTGEIPRTRESFPEDEI